MRRDGMVLIHRVEHRWMAAAIFIGGAIVAFAPLAMAAKEGYREWYGRFGWWAAISFPPFLAGAIFYLGRSNALFHRPRERVLVHELGVFGRVTAREIPVDAVREVRHRTEVIRTRRGESCSYVAELVLADDSVVRFHDGEVGAVALGLARTVNRPLQRTRGPHAAFATFRWTAFAILLIGLIVMGVFVGGAILWR